MWSIFRKEFAGFFNSLIAYVVIGVFLLLVGLLFWFYPESNILDYGYAEMDSFFSLVPYILLFFVPAVTMRMFSEEIKSGTLELLLTRPLSLWHIIVGKYFACVVIVLLALVPTVVYYVSIYFLGNPVGNIDSAVVFGSYFGLLLLASVYAAIGLFMSSLTKNQVVAFLLTAALGFVLFSGFSQAALLFSGDLYYYLSFFSLSTHYSSLGRGFIDSRDVVFLVSVSIIFLVFTFLAINRIRK